MSAQQTSGSIGGTVTDSKGGVIVGANVTLTDQLRDFRRQMQSNSEGMFVFTPLQPSLYTLVVGMGGFKTLEKHDIKLDANDRVSVPDLALEVGALSEVVTVEASAVQLQVDSADKSSLITEQQVVDMPIIDRGFLGLLETVPGAVNSSQYTANINGGRDDQNSFKVDGITNMDSGVSQCCATWVNVDTIAEFVVKTNSQTADIGHSGGAAISVVTKSGTKEFHGSGYYFMRNESLNANTWMNNYNNRPRSIYRYGTGGFTLGGPVFIPRLFNTARNKLFFFASEELQRQLSPVSLQTKTVPTAAERAGDFSASHDSSGKAVTVYDPAATVGSTRVAFPGNVVPQSRISKDGQSILSVFPLPNYCCDNGYNYTSSKSSRYPQHMDSARGDYNVSDRTRAYVRWSHQYGEQTSYYGLSNVDTIGNTLTKRSAWSAVLNLATAITPTLTNEFIFGVSHNYYDNGVSDVRYTRSKLGLTYQSLYPNSILGDLGPAATFSGSSLGNAPTLLGGAAFYNPGVNDNTNFNITDNVAKAIGVHLLKAGFAFERDRKDQTNVNPTGVLSFNVDSANPLDSNWGFANALLGNFDTYSQPDKQRVGKYRYSNAEWYVADTVKLTRNLTVDVGVRFYVVQPLYDAKNQIASFNPSLWNASKAVTLYQRQKNPANNTVMAYNPTTGQYLAAVYIGAIIPGSGDINNGFVLAGQNGYPRGLFQSPGVQFAPRLGIAWQLDSKTVIRTGGGIFYDRVQGNGTYDSLNLPPTTRTPTLYYGSLYSIGSVSQTNFPPSVQGGFGEDSKTPTVYNYNFSIQRQLPFQTLLDAGYVGSLSRHLQFRINVNQPGFGSAWLPQNQDPTTTAKYDGTTTLPVNFYRPYTGVGDIVMMNTGGTANYNSVQIKLNRRMAKGLQIGGSYVFSKALGVASSIYTSENPFDMRHTNYGRLDYDVTQSLSFNYSYHWPRLARTKLLDHPVIRLLLNGWQSSGITTFQSGMPASVSYSLSGISNLQARYTGQPNISPRVLISGNPVLTGGDRTLDAWFDTSVFSPALKGSHGNDSGVAYLTKPGVNNWNMTLFKNVYLPRNERRYFQFRLEGYNAFNHTQWSGMATSITFDPATNKITNLPTSLGGGGGRFGVGAANAVRNPRYLQLAAKFYF